MPEHSGTFQRHFSWGALALIPAALFLGLFLNENIDPRTIAPEQHFYVVSVAALICFALALVAVRAAARTDSARIYLMSIGFLTMSGLFAIHGLATPGFILDARYFVVTGFSARIAIWFGALFLALSLTPMPPRWFVSIGRFRMRLFASVGVALLAYAVAALEYPESVPPRIISARLFLDGTLISVIAMSAVAAIGYARLYRRTGIPVYGAVVVGSILLAEAQVAMHFGELWRWSWWIYHLQLLGAFLVISSVPFAAADATDARDREAESSEARLAA